MSILEERLVYKPFKYPFAYEYFEKSEKMHWLWTEVQMIEDVSDWKTRLTEEEKRFVTNIFRFFTQGDCDVGEAYITQYMPRFRHPELRMMMASFAAREMIHVAAYSHLIETVGMPESTYNEFLQYKEMVEKHEFFNETCQIEDSLENLAYQIAVFSAFTEGVQLFSSFIMLLNFVRFGKMKGMGQIISWSIADENLHVEGMIKVFRTLIQENIELWTDELKTKIYEAAKTIVKLEDDFVDLAFSNYLIEGLDKDGVKEYVRYIANKRLIQLGMKPIFEMHSDKNPLPWVEGLLGVSHTNFFENRSTEYAKGALTGSWEDVWGAWSSF